MPIVRSRLPPSHYVSECSNSVPNFSWSGAVKKRRVLQVPAERLSTSRMRRRAAVRQEGVFRYGGEASGGSAVSFSTTIEVSAGKPSRSRAQEATVEPGRGIGLETASDGTSGRLLDAALSDLQTGCGVGRSRSEGRTRRKVYFVRQLAARDRIEKASHFRSMDCSAESHLAIVDDRNRSGRTSSQSCGR